MSLLYDRVAASEGGAERLAVARLRRQVLRCVHVALEASGLTRAELAGRLGVSGRTVDRVLDGDGDIRAGELARWLHALGYEADVRLVEAGEPRRAAVEHRAVQEALPEDDRPARLEAGRALAAALGDARTRDALKAGRHVAGSEIVVALASDPLGSVLARASDRRDPVTVAVYEPPGTIRFTMLCHPSRQGPWCVPATTVDAAEALGRVLAEVCTATSLPVQLFPLPDGGVQAEWHVAGASIEIEVDSGGAVFVNAETSTGEILVESELDDDAGPVVLEQTRAFLAELSAGADPTPAGPGCGMAQVPRRGLTGAPNE